MKKQINPNDYKPRGDFLARHGDEIVARFVTAWTTSVIRREFGPLAATVEINPNLPRLARLTISHGDDVILTRKFEAMIDDPADGPLDVAELRIRSATDAAVAFAEEWIASINGAKVTP